MGARIEFKGGACRLFETFLDEQNRTWQDFLKDVIDYSFKATRINGVDDPIEARKFLKFKRLDIALDERFNEKGNYNLMDLWEKVRKGQIEMKLKGFRPEEEFKMSDGFLKSLGSHYILAQFKVSFDLTFMKKIWNKHLGEISQ